MEAVVDGTRIGGMVVVGAAGAEVEVEVEVEAGVGVGAVVGVVVGTTIDEGALGEVDIDLGDITQSSLAQSGKISGRGIKLIDSCVSYLHHVKWERVVQRSKSV